MLFVVAAFLAWTGTAAAATAFVQGGAVRFVADAGELNRVVVDPVPSNDALVIRDPGAVIEVGSRCTSLDAHRVRCDRAGFEQPLKVMLGSGNDSVVARSVSEDQSFDTTLRGGRGKEDDGSFMVAVFCPECAEREFGKQRAEVE